MLQALSEHQAVIIVATCFCWMMTAMIMKTRKNCVSGIVLQLELSTHFSYGAMVLFEVLSVFATSSFAQIGIQMVSALIVLRAISSDISGITRTQKRMKYLVLLFTVAALMIGAVVFLDPIYGPFAFTLLMTRIIHRNSYVQLVDTSHEVKHLKSKIETLMATKSHEDIKSDISQTNIPLRVYSPRR